MDLKEARKIVDNCEKLPADKYKEAVEVCIAGDVIEEVTEEVEEEVVE